MTEEDIEQFQDFTLSCGRGHDDEIVETERVPDPYDSTLERRYRCPKCGQLYKVYTNEPGTKSGIRRIEDNSG